MLKLTPSNRVLFVRRTTPVQFAILGVFLSLFLIFLNSHAAYATAASTVNFQARLQSSSGAIVPDGYYNVEFKLYSVASAGTALWTEDYTSTSGPGSTDVRIQVSDGYLSAALGSINPFPNTIDWSQQLYLTMNIGGTGTTASWDGEMSPRLALTSSTYAFKAGSASSASELSTVNGSYTSTLNIQAPTGGNQTFLIQDQGAAGTYDLLTTQTANNSFVQLQSGTPSQQTGQLDISGAATVGSIVTTSLDTASTANISIGYTHASSIALGNTTSNITTTINGTAIVKPTSGHDSTSAFQVQSSGGTSVLNVDTSNTEVSIGTSNEYATITVQGATNDSSASAFAATDSHGNNILKARNDGQVTIGRSAGSNSILGYNRVGANPDTGWASTIAADKITTGAVASTLNSITVYVQSPIASSPYNKYILGIYSDSSGLPGSLIASSSQGALTADAWNTLTVSASLSANTTYWLAFSTNTTAGTDPYVPYDTGGTGTTHAFETSWANAGSSMPSTFSSSGTSSILESIYANVTESGSLATTLTVDPSTGVNVATPNNTTTAFQVQNAGTTSIFDVDTSNGRVGIGTNAPTAQLQVKNTTSNTTLFDLQDSTGFDTLMATDAGKITLGKAPAGSIGNGVIGTAGGNDFGNLISQKFTTSSTGGGALASMSVYIHTGVTAGKLAQMGIYADTTSGCGASASDCAGALIASTSQSQMTPNAWNTLPITATLSANTTYWLAYWTNDNNASEVAMVNPSGAGSPLQMAQGVTFAGSMPSTFPTIFFNDSSYETSIYATYANSGSQLTADPTSNAVTLGYNTKLVLQGPSASVSNPQGFTSSEAFGANASVSGNYATAVGSTTSVAANGTAVGFDAISLNSGTAIGYGAQNTGVGSVAIGYGAISAINATSIGVDAVATNYSIAIGTNAVNSTGAAHQLVIGSSSANNAYISDAYIGSGVTDTAPQSTTLHATGGQGTDIAGANLNLAGGIGTGAGNGGNINLQIAKPGTTGTSANSLSTVESISGVNGATTFKNSSNSTAAFQVQNATGTSLLNVDTTNSAIGLGSAPIQIGYTTRAGNLNAGGQNGIQLQQITTSSAGTLDSISVYFANVDTSPNNKYQVAIYSDNSGSPGAKVATSGDNIITGGVWNTATLSATLSASTSYWIAVTQNATSSTKNETVYDNSGGNYKFWSPGAVVNGTTVAYGAWPSTFVGGPAANSSGTQPISIYANVTGQTASYTIASDINGHVAIGGTGATSSLYQLSLSAPTIYGYAANIQGETTINASGTEAFNITNGSFTDLGVDSVNRRVEINGSDTTPGSTASLNVYGSGTNGLLNLLNSSSVQVVSVSSSGAATFQNSTDSNSAFNIEDLSSNSLLNVDTSGHIVSVGSTGSQALSTTTNIGTSSGAAQTVNVGSTTGSSQTAIQGGTNGISLQTGAGSSATGSISITTGNSSSSVAGNVTIDTGTGVLTGTNVLSDTFEGSGSGSLNDLGTSCNFGCTVAASNAAAHGGSYSMAISETSQFWGESENYMALSTTPGHIYQFTAWFKAGTANESLSGTMHWSGAPDTSLGSVSATTSGWTEMTAEVTAPAGSTSAYFEFDSSAGANGHIMYVDDIVIKDVSNVTTPYVNIGATNAEAITLGNLNQAGITKLLGGAGGINEYVATNAFINLGTQNANNINIGNSSGVVVVQGGGTGAFQVQNASNSAVLDVDTTNNSVGIGTSSPSTNRLSVAGATSDNTTNALNIANSLGANLVQVSDDGTINLGGGANPGVIGYSTQGSNAGSGQNGLLIANKFTAPRTGAITSLSAYFGEGGIDSSPNNHFQLGIYADSSGTPGAYIASTAVGTLNSSAAWNTLPISNGTASLTAGTSYWLAFWTNEPGTSSSGLNTVPNNSGVAGAAGYSNNATFGSGSSNGMPTSFPTSGGSSDSGYQRSIYGTYGNSGTSISSAGNLTSYGSATFSSSTNSSTAFQIQNASGTNLFNVDTSSSNVNIGSTGTTTLSSTVNIATSTGASQTINIGSGSSETAAITVGNTNTSTQLLLQGGTGSSAVGIQAGSSGTISVGTANANVITIGNTSSNNALTLRANGISQTITGSSSAPSEVVKTTTNSTAAFQVQDSNSNNLLSVDTSNKAVSFGSNVNRVGYTTVASTINGGDQNGMEGFKITPSASGTLRSISVYLNTPGSGNSFQVALYADGSACGVLASCPGTLIASSGSNTVVGHVWNTATLSASLTAGTSYWLVVNHNGTGTDDSSTVFDSTGGNYVYASQTFGTWPSTWSPSFTATHSISIYANENVSGTSYDLTADGNGTTTVGNSSAQSGGAAAFNVLGSSLVQAAAPDAFVVNGSAGGPNPVLAVDTNSSVVSINANAYSNTNVTLYVKNMADNHVGEVIVGTGTQSANLFNIVNDTTSNHYDLTMAAGGATTFSTATNTSSAFQIQNSTYANIFSVDTSNGRVTIGSGASGESSASILVLDNQTGTGSEPAEVDGGMYYSVNLKAFRCGINGAWQSCGPMVARLTSDVSTSSTAASDVTGLTFPVAASTDYSLTCNLMYTSSNSGTGVRFGINGPASPTAVDGSTTIYNAIGVGTPTFVSFNAVDNTTGTTSVSATSTNYPAEVSAIFRNGSTAGTLALRVSASAANSVSVKAGSSCQLLPLK